MKPKILVIDDDFSIRENLETFLLLSDYSVSLASSGTEALHIAGTNHFDLVITDLNMPGYDGNVFTKWLSKTPDPAPVIFITGLPEEVEPNPIIIGILLKPPSLSQLKELIARALNKFHFQHYSTYT